MRAQHGKMRDVIGGAVHADFTVVQQRQRDGVFQPQAQFAVHHELLQPAGSGDLRRRRARAEDAAVIVAIRENLGGGG